MERIASGRTMYANPSVNPDSSKFIKDLFLRYFMKKNSPNITKNETGTKLNEVCEQAQTIVEKANKVVRDKDVVFLYPNNSHIAKNTATDKDENIDPQKSSRKVENWT